jgi:C2 domain
VTANDWAGLSDSFVALNYNHLSYASKVVYNASHPTWNELFVVPENSSLLTRRMRLEVRCNAGYPGSVLKDSTLYGGPVLKDSTLDG